MITKYLRVVGIIYTMVNMRYSNYIIFNYFVVQIVQRSCIAVSSRPNIVVRGNVTFPAASVDNIILIRAL